MHINIPIHIGSEVMIFLKIILQNINPLIAKKMTEDRGREYINARRVAKEYEAVTRGLNKNLPSVPPQNNPDEAQQVKYTSSKVQTKGSLCEGNYGQWM